MSKERSSGYLRKGLYAAVLFGGGLALGYAGSEAIETSQVAGNEIQRLEKVHATVPESLGELRDVTDTAGKISVVSGIVLTLGGVWRGITLVNECNGVLRSYDQIASGKTDSPLTDSPLIVPPRGGLVLPDFPHKLPKPE
jgi:hypothetical protein